MIRTNLELNLGGVIVIWFFIYTSLLQLHQICSFKERNDSGSFKVLSRHFSGRTKEDNETVVLGGRCLLLCSVIQEKTQKG
jgi:hypothetical protein